MCRLRVVRWQQKNVWLWAKEKIVEYIEWMENGNSINVSMERILFYIHALVVLRWWNFVGSEIKICPSNEWLWYYHLTLRIECLCVCVCAISLMVINLKFSPVLSKSMYKFLMLLLFFRIKCPTAKSGICEHMRANSCYFFFA